MTPIYHQQSPPLPHLNSNEETNVVQTPHRIQNQRQLLLLAPTNETPFQSPIIFDTNQVEEEQDDDDEYNYLEEQELEQQFSRGGSSDQFLPSPSRLNFNNLKSTISTRVNEAVDRVPGSVKSNPLKESIRNSDQTFMTKPLRKRLHYHYPQPSSLSNTTTSNNSVRVCSDCNTTKTPLWRSGPRGPKSLCNACGIRHRKAIRAMAAVAVNGSLDMDMPTKKKAKMGKRLDPYFTTYYKKRCTIATTSTRKKLCFEMDSDFETENDCSNLHYRPSTETLDYSVGLRESSSVHRVFPKDEEQGAILLMALSCGFIRSR